MVTDFEELVSLCDAELQHREYLSDYYGRIKNNWEILRAWLKTQGVRLLAAELRASRDYHDVPRSGKRAWMLGNEGNGLSPGLLSCADERIRIPMRGKVESLNVAVAAAILLFDK